MNILLVTPSQHRATGNHVTAERYRCGLLRLGHQVAVVEVGGGLPFPETALADNAPQVVHLLHAYRSGLPWLDCPKAHSIPMAVTLTGTDIHEGIDGSIEGPVIRNVLSRATAVITQNPLTYQELRNAAFSPRLHFLPPSILLGDGVFPLRQRLGVGRDVTIFLHPAGIRPVKQNLELLRLFDRLASGQAPPFVLAFCGPVLDFQYGRHFEEEMRRRPWATHLGVVPPEAMADTLRQAEVVLNHSLHEGMPNALLEAAVLGRPMLVRDIPGNAAVAKEGVNALLYRSSEEFVRKAGRLLHEGDLRQALSRPDPEAFHPDREARALEAIYRAIVSP